MFTFGGEKKKQALSYRRSVNMAAASFAALANVDVTVWKWRNAVPKSKYGGKRAPEDTRLVVSSSAGQKENQD